MNKKSETLKRELISHISETREAILQATAQASPEAQETVFLGSWSLKDLLAHLVGWDFANLEAAEAVQTGKLPAFYAHKDKNWATFNTGLVEQYKRNDFEELLALVKDSHRQVIEYLESLPADVLDKDFGVRSRGFKVTIFRLLKAEWMDEREHLQQIQGFITNSR